MWNKFKCFLGIHKWIEIEHYSLYLNRKYYKMRCSICNYYWPFNYLELKNLSRPKTECNYSLA